MSDEKQEDELAGIKGRIAEERAKLIEAIKNCPSIYEGGNGEDLDMKRQVRMLDYILTGEWNKAK